MKRLFLCFVFLSVATSASAKEQIDVIRKDDPARLFAEFGYVSLRNADNDSIYGPTAGLGVVYGFNSFAGIQVKLEQAFAQETNFSTMYSLIELGFVYSVTGRIRDDGQTVQIDGTDVVSTHGKLGNSLRLSVHANQYFLNGPDGVFGFAGVGAGISYYLNFNEDLALSVGVKAAIASNTKTVLDTFQGVVSINFAL